MEKKKKIEKGEIEEEIFGKKKGRKIDGNVENVGGIEEIEGLGYIE